MPTRANPGRDDATRQCVGMDAEQGIGRRVRALPLWVKLVAGIGVVLVAAIVGLMFLPTGQVAYTPVAPVDLQGRVQLDDREAGPLQGRMSLVGVREQRVRMLHKLWLQLREDDVTFVDEPKKPVTMESTTDNDAAMARAKKVASGIGLDLAGDKVDWTGTSATIEQVAPETPAAQAGLRAGDVILDVNGRPMDNSVDAGRAINLTEPGTNLRLRIRRAGSDSTVNVQTVAPEPGDDFNTSRIGVALETIGLEVKLPRPVAIDSEGVAGPSAGLSFALFVYDAASDEDLLKGRAVVATGALTLDGRVTSVSRVRQKAIATQRGGADLLLVPRDDVDEAIAGIREACSSSVRCVRVVPVGSVREAIDLLGNSARLAAVTKETAS